MTPLGPRAYLHYSHTVDPAEWASRHEQGLVPDRLPYGLDRMGEFGVSVSTRGLPRVGKARGLAQRATRLATGGFELPDLVRDRHERCSADVVVCWDERAGAFAAARSRLPGEPPVATGVVWLTDFARLGRRSAAARALASAACIYVNAPAQLDVLTAWGVPPDRVHFIYMAVDADFWRTEGIEPEAALVVGSGNDRHRDHALLVEAMKRLRARRASARLELATHHDVDIPGPLGVRHPHCTHLQMRDLYGRASVVALAVHPNLHLSGLTVLLESMACARPVVATETPGMSEYVTNGTTGLLVDRDPEAIAAAIEALLADPERAREMGRAAREAFERDFTTRHLARNLAALLQAVAK
jgi:glycosyltransferase involved in cell wall biosynthesis